MLPASQTFLNYLKYTLVIYLLSLVIFNFLPADMQIPPVGKIWTHSTGAPWSIDKMLP